MRFTLDGSPELECRISDHMAMIRRAVKARIPSGELSGLILGGGYGRGEGGVLIADGNEQVYNDYDLFVITRNDGFLRKRRLVTALQQVKTEVEVKIGIHVDFSTPIFEKALPNLPYELMLMELAAGHQVIIGRKDLLASIPEYDKARPPLEEGSRLLMNRGMGLLLARGLLEHNDTLKLQEREFVVRNIRKAQLAMGDAVLFLRHRYDPSYLRRLQLFNGMTKQDIPQPDRLKTTYTEAINFKLHPSHDEYRGGSELRTWYDQVLLDYERMFLWFEGHRLGMSGLDLECYCTLPRRLAEKERLEKLKNLARNLHSLPCRLWDWGRLSLHPRDRLLARLPMILFRTAGAAEEAQERYLLRLWGVSA